MASKHQSLENILSRHVQETNQTSDGEDYEILIDKRNWLHVGTTHCTVPTTKIEAFGLKLCNEQLSLGSGLRETVQCCQGDRLAPGTE